MTTTRSPYDPPKADLASPQIMGRQSYYFSVGPLKFMLMSLTTMGLYPIFWFYENWHRVKARENSNISPFWRAFFLPFWTFSMGRRFSDQAQAEEIEINLPATLLGIVYVVANLLVNLPDPSWLVSYLGFIALLPFDYAARRLSGNGELAEPTNGRFSMINIIGALLGGIFMILVIVGTFMYPDAA